MAIDILKAFLIGGAICVIGQLLIDYTKLTPARILVSFVVAGVILSATGIYKYLIDFAGCGATVPIVGFGNLLAEGVKTAVQQKGFIGIFTGGISAAAAGVCGSIFLGYLAALVSKSTDKQ